MRHQMNQKPGGSNPGPTNPSSGSDRPSDRPSDSGSKSGDKR